MGELKVINISQIKYPYGITFQVQTVGTVLKESFFGRIRKVKKPCFKNGTLFKGTDKIIEFNRFHNFHLDVFKLKDSYYLLSKIDSIFAIHDVSSLKSIKLSLKPEQFKTNGEDKLIVIIDKEIIYFKFIKITDSVKLVQIDKLIDFRTQNGVWLEINWESNICFETTLVISDENINRNEYEKYRRMILKCRLDNDKLTYVKSYVEPKS